MSRVLLLLLAMTACSAGSAPAPAPAPDDRRLVFVADPGEAVDEATRDLATNVHGWLGASGIAKDVRVAGRRIEIRPAGSEDRAEVEALVQREYPAQLVAQPCPVPSPGVACFALAPAHAAEVRTAALAQVLAVVQKRVAALDPAAKVTANGAAIAIELANPAAAAEIARVLARRAKLDFRVVDHDAPFVHELVAKVEREAPAGIAVASEEWRTTEGAAEIDRFLVAADRATLARYLAELARRDERFAPPADREFALGQVDARWRTYYLERTVRIGSRSIVDAKVALADAGSPSVTVELDERGARDFERLTSENVGNKLAIVLDGGVVTVPIINGTLAGGRFTISLGGGRDRDGRDATELAGLLRSGALPVHLAREAAKR